MSEQRVIETPASSDLATQTIKINGNKIATTFQIVSIAIAKEIDRVPFAKLVLLDGEASSAEFNASNEDLFVPGNEIEILTGYHSEEETIFKGIIIKHSLKVRQSGSAQLIIECRDEAIKLTLGRKSKYFYESSDSDIIEEILGDYNLTPDVDSTSVSHAEMIQYDVSDWDFILTRAEANGLMTTVDDGNIAIKAPDFAQSATLSLEYGSTIFEFDADIDSRNQFTTVKSKNWDQANQEIVEVEAADPGATLNGNITADDLASNIEAEEYTMPFGGSVPEEMLQAWADSKMLRDRISKTRGRVRFQGVNTVKPAMIIELKGVGERFNGNAFVTGVYHSISNGQWSTDVQFGIDPEWFYKKFELNNRFDNILPGIKGLQIGVVVQLEEDPDGEDRIKVKLPIIDTDEEGVWARLSCLDAGDSRGTFFRPEVDDEVIVGFIDDDVLNPVVLGMLHSSAKPTPQEITADNNEKGYISRGEMKLLFDDDKVSITLETPAGKKFVIDEDDGSIILEDENGNKILMDSDGITIESASDLNIKASGDVNIEGVNISNAAQASFKGDGSGGAELTSSAIVKVEGSLVQIN